MHILIKHSWSIALLLATGACGSDDESGSDTSAAETAGTTSTPSAGKVAGSAGRTSGAGASGRASAAGTTGSVSRAGSAAPQQPSTAGKSGAGGASVDLDEDAGVPEAGSSGSSAAAGSGGAGSGGAASEAGSGGAASEAGSGGSSASAATFTQVYALLSTSCAGARCHVNATIPAAMLSLEDKATAYENLVNVDATECPGEKRVVPNDAANSELVASLKHVQVGSCASTPRMPDDLPRWDDADIELVSSWIEAGALNN